MQSQRKEMIANLIESRKKSIEKGNEALGNVKIT